MTSLNLLKMLDLIAIKAAEIVPFSRDMWRLVKFFTKWGYTDGRYRIPTRLQ
jgi:hypothetical protein